MTTAGSSLCCMIYSWRALWQFDHDDVEFPMYLTIILQLFDNNKMKFLYYANFS